MIRHRSLGINGTQVGCEVLAATTIISIAVFAVGFPCDGRSHFLFRLAQREKQVPYANIADNFLSSFSEQDSCLQCCWLDGVLSLERPAKVQRELELVAGLLSR